MTPAWTLLPEGIDPLAFLLLGGLAALLVSAAKAGFGGSVGLLSAPMMIYACGRDVKLATGLMLPLLMAADQVAVVSWWRQWDWRTVRLLLGGAVVGVAGGGAALAWLEHLERTGAKQAANAWLMLAIGAIALGFVALQALRALRTRPLPFRPVLWQGTCFGAAAGLTSTLAHAAGPVTAMYLLPQRPPKHVYAASTVLYYWIGNALKLPVYLYLGRLDARAARAAAVLMPAVVAGTLLGLFCHRRLGQRQFNVVVYALLALTGVHLIVESVGILAG
jgi:hypothetical protein